MNKNFWERVNRLQGLAERATPGPWNKQDKPYILYEAEKKNITTWHEDDHSIHTFLIAKATDFGTEDDAAFIAAANPAMILEMIAKMRNLQKELNDTKAQVGRKVKRIGILEADLERLREAAREAVKEGE